MSSFDKRRQGDGRRRAKRSRPWLEVLEDRVVLSTFRVNTTLDTVAVSLKTGKDASGHISLRSAIMAADAKGAEHRSSFPPGTFTLTIAGAGEDDDATGDLDITGNLTIKGQGASKTIVDGNNLDRVFDILGGKVSISKLTIQHGRVAGEGGGILNSGGKVTLSSVRIIEQRRIGLPAPTARTVRIDDRPRRQPARRGRRDRRRGGRDLQAAGPSSSPQHDRVQRGDGGAGGAGGNGGEGVGANGRHRRRTTASSAWAATVATAAPAAPAWAAASSTRPARA